MAAEYDLNITRGSQFSVRLIAQNEDGTPLNLSGHGVRGYVRNSYTSPVLLDLNPQKVVGFETSGYIDILLTSIQTSGVPITEAVYDIEVFNSGSSYVEKLIKGYADILPEVTY